MPRFNLDDYETVESRVKRFYGDHEDGRITTELLSSANDIGTAVVKAYIYIGDVLVSTGLAFEKAGGNGPNQTSHLENAETSAIGRGLANYNYSGNKRASREEMAKVNRGEQAAGYEEATNKLLACTSMDALAETWASLTPAERKALADVKDSRKAALEEPPEAPADDAGLFS